MNNNISPLFHILQFKMLKHAIYSIREHSRLKIFVISLSVIGLFAGMLVLSFEAFGFLEGMAGIGVIIIERLLYLLYFSLFIMLIFSNIIIAYSTANRSRETQYLMSLPLEYEAIYSIKFFEIIIYSSWAFLFFLLPIMFAFGMVKHTSWYFYPAVVIFFIPFAVIASNIGAIITLVFAPWFDKQWFKRMLIAIFVVFGIWAIFKLQAKRQIMGGDEFFLAFGQIIPHFGVAQYKILPSFWITEGISEIGGNFLKQAAFWWLLLFANALGLQEVCRVFSRKLYYNSWLSAQNPQGKKIYIFGKSFIDYVAKILFFVPRKLLALITKDLKFFWRDPVQWSQFTIFFGLLGIYFANIRNLGYESLLPFWKNVMAFLNMGSTTLTLASLSVRFIFPQFSLEGKNFWILGLAPINFKDIVWEKFWVNTISLLLVSLPLIVISNSMLGVTWQIMLISIILVVIMTITLVGLAVGIGTIFPNFKQENPAQIVSGFGGTLLLVINLAYVLAVIISVAIPFHRYYVLKELLPVLFYKELFVIMAALCTGSLALIFLSLHLGIKALRNMEF